MATSTALAGQAFRMTAAEAAAAVAGRVAAGAPETALTGVSTDSRTTRTGNLFVALRGESFDGHTFVGDAARRGAAAALVLADRVGALAGAGLTLIAVEADTLRALGALGRAHRDRHAAPFVGITGSAGKSTAKEMTAAVLAWGGRRVLKTEGNLNNRIGVPLTVMSAEADHAACVIEMGISFQGEMPELVRIARPDVRVVLNAGSSHLEFLGSPDGVAAEKARIWDEPGTDAWMVWNADDERVAREAAARGSAKRLSFGRSGSDVRIRDVRPGGFGGSELTLVVRGETLAVRLPLFGAHHVTNAAAATAAGVALGVPNEEIAAGLESRFAPMPGRGDLRRLRGDVVLVDDTYNSNPTSAQAALSALEATRRAGRTRILAALGDMLELGDAAREEHARIGSWAARVGVHALYLFGPNAGSVVAGACGEPGGTVALPARMAEHPSGEIRVAAAAAAASGHRPECHVFSDRGALAERLLADLRPGDAVLVKGSRGMRMDEVVATVVAERGEV